MADASAVINILKAAIGELTVELAIAKAELDESQKKLMLLQVEQKEEK